MAQPDCSVEEGMSCWCNNVNGSQSSYEGSWQKTVHTIGFCRQNILENAKYSGGQKQISVAWEVRSWEMGVAEGAQRNFWRWWICSLWVYTIYVITYQIVYFKCMQFIICQLYLNKVGGKKKSAYYCGIILITTWTKLLYSKVFWGHSWRYAPNDPRRIPQSSDKYQGSVSLGP